RRNRRAPARRLPQAARTDWTSPSTPLLGNRPAAWRPRQGGPLIPLISTCSRPRLMPWQALSVPCHLPFTASHPSSQQDTAGARLIQGGGRRKAGHLAVVPPQALRFQLAWVAQRLVLLDVEAGHGGVVEVVGGPEAARADALHGAEIGGLGDVAGDAERADGLARLVTDEPAAAFEEQRAVGKFGQRSHERRLFLLLRKHLARGAVERERRERLAVGDLEAQERGAVLLLERLHAAAGVEHDRGERVGLAALGRGEGAGDDLVRLGEADRAHGVSFLSVGESVKGCDVERAGAALASGHHRFFVRFSVRFL